MADQSYTVHLQSLLDFAQELKTQLSGMSTPIDHLQAMAGEAVLWGQFDEANSLAASHHAAIAEMSQLLGEVQQAIGFAENVTNTVATGYRQADQQAANSMQVTTGYATGQDTSGNSQSLWASVFGPGGTGT